VLLQVARLELPIKATQVVMDRVSTQAQVAVLVVLVRLVELAVLVVAQVA
jgi:hypothetical protein